MASAANCTASCTKLDKAAAMGIGFRQGGHGGTRGSRRPAAASRRGIGVRAAAHRRAGAVRAARLRHLLRQAAGQPRVQPRPLLGVTRLAVAGLAIRIEAPPVVEAALRERCGPFLAPPAPSDVTSAPPDVTL